MRATRRLLGGLALGSALMYWFDPQNGRRRRRRLRDGLTHLQHRAAQTTRAAARDLEHRARGTVTDAVHSVEEGCVPDDVLTERVRAELGHVTSHPHAIETSAQDGVVWLRGPVLTRERARLVRRIQHVRGVCDIVDELEAYDEPGTIPALQGGPTRAGAIRTLPNVWAPGPRMVLAGLGLLALGRGLQRRGVSGALTGIAGGVVTARALTNVAWRPLLGVGAGPGAVEVVKELHVNAPAEVVYACWRAFENFPRFMSHVLAVEAIGEDRYRWTVQGPLGIPVRWEAELTSDEPNEHLAWTVRRGLVRNQGVVRFERDDQGGTRINLRMTYTPPGGLLGHLALGLFGADAKHRIDDDLVRLKSLIEVGKATGREETVTKEEIQH